MKIDRELLRAAVLAAALTVLAHGVTLEAPFLWDDVDVVTPGGRLLAPGRIPSFFGHAHWIRPNNEGVRPYRPLRDTWLALIASFAGDDPRPYHAGNLLLQAANVFLLYLLARRLLPGRAAPRLAAAFFAVHPMHTEAVAWVKNSAELLALFFGLLAALAFMRAARERSRRCIRFEVAAIICFLLGVLTKESILPLPAILVLWAFLWRDESEAGERGASPWRAVLLSLPLWCIALASAAYQYATTKGAGPMAAAGGAAGAGLWGRLTICGGTVGRYLRMLFLPALNRPIHTLGADAVPQTREAFGGVAVLIIGLLLVGLIILHARRRRRAAFGLWWTLLSLGPVANLLAVNGERPLAEQRLYAASAGAAILMAAVFAGAAGRRRAVLAAALVIIVAWAGMSVHAGQAWRSRMEFWRWGIRTVPRHRITAFNLGVALADHGHERRAVAAYRYALRLRPDYALPAYNLGNLLARNAQGDLAAALGRSPDEMYDQARQLLEQAVRSAPSYARAWNSLGFVYSRLGRDDEALTACEHAHALAPESLAVRSNLAAFYLQSGADEYRAGRYAEAARQLQAGVEHALAAGRRPDPAHFLAWAESWVRLKKPALAVRILREAGACHPESKPLGRRLQQLLDTSPEADPPE